VGRAANVQVTKQSKSVNDFELQRKHRKSIHLHRDSWEREQSHPGDAWVSGAPVQAETEYPVPWSHLSPANETCSNNTCQGSATQWTLQTAHRSSTITDTAQLAQLLSLIQRTRHLLRKSDDRLLPIANSSGICHCGWHDKKWVGWHGILKSIYVSQKVGEVQAHSQQFFRATYQTKIAVLFLPFHGRASKQSRSNGHQ